ncbi:MAG: hypothetical protein F4X36_12380, partial [Gammaproteobacteria bacterium]|nr:hypothetical protein [Gammaproteobacteria bacterium]
MGPGKGTRHGVPSGVTATRSLGLSTKTAYWVGQLAEGLKSTTFALFLLFYYNQVLGLSGSLCAIALMMATAIDAITDPLMGSVSDGWRSRWGRRHPFMYASAIPLAIFFYALFAPPVDSEIGLFAWLLCFSVLARIAMTLYSVPHMALGVEMTSDYQERTVIVAGRSVFGIIGTLLVYAFGFGMFFGASDAYENGQLNPVAYPPFALVIAFLMVASIVGSALGTHHLIPSLLQPTNPQHGPLKQVVLDMLEALKSVSFRWLVMGFVIIAAPVGVGEALALYMYTFFWEVAAGRMIYIFALIPIGTVIGYMFAPLLGRYLEKRELLILGALGWVVFAVAPVCLHYIGLFPAPATMDVLVALAFCSFMSGLLVSQVTVAVGSMLGDVADEQELSTGKRQEGV